MNDSLTLRGDIRQTITHGDGRVEVVEYHNLVVTVGKTVVTRLLGGHAAYKNLEEVNQIAFGTSDAAPAVGDSSITGALHKAATVSYPAPNQVTFTAEMGSTEGNGQTWKEVGLLTKTAEYLFSRALIGGGAGFAKSSGAKIRIEWTISVT